MVGARLRRCQNKFARAREVRRRVNATLQASAQASEEASARVLAFAQEAGDETESRQLMALARRLQDHADVDRDGGETRGASGT